MGFQVSLLFCSAPHEHVFSNVYLDVFYSPSCLMWCALVALARSVWWTLTSTSRTVTPGMIAISETKSLDCQVCREKVGEILKVVVVLRSCANGRSHWSVTAHSHFGGCQDFRHEFI